MTPQSHAWQDGLRAFLAEDRKRPRHRSTPDPELAVINEATRIVAESVCCWADHDLPAHLAARVAWIERDGDAASLDPDPVILLTTTPLGLAVAGQLLTNSRHDVICLLEVEYRRWCRLQPDDAMQHHVTAWNWVKTHLPKVRQGDFPAFPLAPGEQYWLHRTGIAGVSPEEIRNTALLAFNGTTSRLLAASTVETRFED